MTGGVPRLLNVEGADSCFLPMSRVATCSLHVVVTVALHGVCIWWGLRIYLQTEISWNKLFIVKCAMMSSCAFVARRSVRFFTNVCMVFSQPLSAPIVSFCYFP